MASYNMLGKPQAQEQFSEFKLRVPKNLVKKYNVMSINAPRPIKLDEVKEANMVRKTKKQVFVEEDVSTEPKYGAGSVYNLDRKEEARRKKYGFVKKTVNKEDLPYALRLGGKGGKRYTGRKEATMLDHSAYFILTQCPDGVFEAIPVQGWYNFTPDISYATMTADEVEDEFARRTRNIAFISNKYKLNDRQDEKEDTFDHKNKKVRDSEGSFIVHDDREVNLEDDLEMSDDEEDGKKKKKSKLQKEKSMFRGKKKKTESGSEAEDSEEEEDFDKEESKEVDYMSESSSEDEEAKLEDDPEPEKAAEKQAKDEMNVFSDTSEDEDEDELNEAGKELKAIMKKETGDDESDVDVDDDDDEDDDFDEDDKYSKSALFMQNKDSKKKKLGSGSGSKPSSRSATPIPASSSASDSTLSQASKQLQNGKAGQKRPSSRLGMDNSVSESPNSKKSKSDISSSGAAATGRTSTTPLDDLRRRSPSSRSATPTQSSTSGGGDGPLAITEDAIRKYLLHKPMTTTDLVRKFKTRKTGLTKEQTVSAIAAVLKRVGPDQEKIDGKLYLSLKNKK